MPISSSASLRASGMTASSCPVTNRRSPNVAKSFGDFSISYNSHTADYGSETTALVLLGRVFFALNGKHAEQMCSAASSHGIQGCIDYFVENIAAVNFNSEHGMATGLSSDPFNLMETTLAVIGQSNIDKIAQASA